MLMWFWTIFSLGAPGIIQPIHSRFFDANKTEQFLELTQTELKEAPYHREHISGFQVTPLYISVFPKIEADPIKRLRIFCAAVYNSEQFMILNSGE